MKPIVLIPLGEVNIDLLSRLKDELSEMFNTCVSILFHPIQLPLNAYNARRKQYHSTIILDNIRSTNIGCGKASILIVTDLDLYVSGLNFVFGQAESPGNYAIVSLHRLRPEFYGGEPDSNLLAERLLKEAVHELGHTYGLKHCSNPRCVMSFSNSILDVDIKSFRFCESCRIRLSELTRVS
ncbi:MAG: archaemetzincin family Zn-dependent metalloprotease [Candidatus Bathyarchaeia archaeon]|nr:archaemetzincin family Zn-dependent metalloprotease [Candidatus Bathyarchaeota archaeon]